MYEPVVSIIIPAFNEAETVGDVVSAASETMDVYGMPYEILVVDDGSTDNTGQAVARCKATLLSNRGNMGKGQALRRGFASSRGDIIVTLDADGSHDPKEIVDLVDALLKGADVVNGARFLGQNNPSTSKVNRLGVFFFNLLVLVVTRKWVWDSQTGFRALKRSVLNTLDLQSRGFDIEVEVLVKVLKKGFRLHEMPVKSEPRRSSASKLRIHRDGLRIFTRILRARFF